MVQDNLSCLVLFWTSKPGKKNFGEPETKHYEKIDKSFLNTIGFYLEDDDHKKITFNGQPLTFTSQFIKI